MVNKDYTDHLQRYDNGRLNIHAIMNSHSYH